MSQKVNHADVIQHQAAIIFTKDQEISARDDAISQLSASNRQIASQYKALQEKAGLAKDDPLYINFDQPAANEVKPPVVTDIKTAVRNAATAKARQRKRA